MVYSIIRSKIKLTVFFTFAVKLYERIRGVFMAVNESAENYLETILMLSQTLQVVRSVEIANELNFKNRASALL